MKASLFKKLVSYAMGVHVESMSSDYNETLDVYLVNGRYQLCTPNAIYSYADKYENFKESFEKINLDKHEIEHVLLLGFGLGSIPFMLETLFQKNYSYTGIEIDDTIIYLASKYVVSELKSEVELIQADAYSYIHQSNFKYDMICIDIFVDDEISDVFLDLEFLEAVKENLSEDGFVLFNHLNHNAKDKASATVYYNDIFTKVFEDATFLDVKGNKIMVSQKGVMK